MPNGVTISLKQAAFARAYLECSNASEAYRRTYSHGGMTNKTVVEAASRLLKNGKVAAIIAAERERLQEVHENTREQLAHELDVILSVAMRQKNPQTASAVAAVMGKAKLYGRIVDKSEVLVETVEQALRRQAQRRKALNGV